MVRDIIVGVISAVTVALLAVSVSWFTDGGLTKLIGAATQKDINDVNTRIGNIKVDISWNELVEQKTRTPGTIPIEPPGSTPWGIWNDPEYCPTNHYICGISQRVEPQQGDGDDTAMNGLRFYCCSL